VVGGGGVARKNGVEALVAGEYWVGVTVGDVDMIFLNPAVYPRGHSARWGTFITQLHWRGDSPAQHKETKVEEGHLMPDHVDILLSILPKFGPELH
jgi:hypothetical protein